MTTENQDDVLDALVARYCDRVANGGSRDPRDLLEQVPEEHRAALARCLRMVDVGSARGGASCPPLGPGTRLGGFVIERELGRGGMAIVYLAAQPELGRKVALKVLRPGLAFDLRHVDRFRREALAIARLQHPHIVQVYAVGEEHGWHYLAMEHVDGRNLAEIYAELASIAPRARTREDLARAARAPALVELGASYAAALAGLLAPVARAIGVAHELGIVHRDVKPSNVLVHRDGRALIVDFGLAKGDGDPGLSLTGEPLGTPYYMSPEQAEADANAVDERTDVYSLGVTLYEGLAGRRPFEGESALAVLDKVRRENPPALTRLNPSIGASVDALVARATARERSQRYRGMLELAADLAAAASGLPTQALAFERGVGRQLALGLRHVFLGLPFEYRSRASFLGWPLVDVQFPGRVGQPSRAFVRGWIAIGDRALGVLALGRLSVGVVSFGAVSFGLLAFGGAAIGGIALAGTALGWFAGGGVALGLHDAVGGVAVAFDHAAGGFARAEYVLSAARRDPVAVEHFRRLLGPFAALFLGR